MKVKSNVKAGTTINVSVKSIQQAAAATASQVEISVSIEPPAAPV